MAAPRFIYGTAWKEAETERLTRLALDTGFRAIDTANQRKHYFEAAVGAALAGRRDGVFVQTKFTYLRGQDHRLPYDEAAPLAIQVEQSFQSSLEHLGTDHVDSYLLHGPSQSHGFAQADVDAWRALEAIHGSGRAKAIGISNVSAEQLQRLIEIANVQPAYVQNRCYASSGWNADVRALCRERGIGYQGFSLLTANRRDLVRPMIDEIMMRTGKTREQLVFAFAMQLGMIPLTGTSSADHMREDLESLDLRLTEADVHTIEHIGH
ncbi:MAG TPA: aldo/keto reductase [Kofleriaceae bacterium]